MCKADTVLDARCFVDLMPLRNGSSAEIGRKMTGGVLSSKENTAEKKEHGQSTLFIYVAMAVDLAVAAAKLVVGLIAGSAAMLAESAHSFADTTNQVFLLVGIKLSDRPADEDHPYGHGKDRVFWAFLAAIFIFVSGSFFSLYEGIRQLLAGKEHDGGFWTSYIVLGASLLFDLISIAFTFREVRNRAREAGVGLVRFLRIAPTMTLKTTFYSDIAAVLGVVIAAGGLFFVQMTGNGFYDGAASVIIGVILISVALILGFNARDVLLGSAAAPSSQRQIRGAITSFPEVTEIIELLTMQLGQASILVTGKINIKDGLNTEAIERLLDELTGKIREAEPKARNIYLEPRSPSKGS